MESEPVVTSPEFVAVLVQFFNLETALTTRNLGWNGADSRHFSEHHTIISKLKHWAKMEERYK